jgi:hypothetical protein
MPVSTTAHIQIDDRGVAWIDGTRRLLFSQDEDLLVEATLRQRSGRHCSGVIYGHQLELTIRRAIRDLELLAQAGGFEDFADRIEYLPL